MSGVDNALLDQKRLGSLSIDQGQVVGNPAVDAYSYEELLIRLDLLETQWATFVQNDLIIQRYSDANKDRSYLKKNQYATVESSFVKTEAYFKSRIASMKPMAPGQAFEASNQNRTSANLIQTQVQLQTGNVSDLELTNLHTVSGKQRDWETYKEQLEAMVKSKNIIPLILKFR